MPRNQARTSQGRTGLILLFLCAALPVFAQAPASRASALMKRKLYDDAVKVLVEEIEGQPEAECATKYLMIGECLYLQGKYADARPWYAKALKVLGPGKNQTIAEYRLACLAFRSADPAGAIKATEDFVRKYPDDKRSGRLLLFKMKALVPRGKSAVQELEATRERLQDGAGHYGSAASLAADKIMTDFYLAHDMEDRAVSGYMNIVNNFRNVQQQYASENRPVPAALQEARDYAAMQLATIAIKADKAPEATKWLASIRFDQDLIQRSRLMLAQIAYKKRDYEGAMAHLTRDGFIKTVPAGAVRSDMYLLLGFCAKNDRNPSMEKVVGYFGKVDPGSKAYGQAQMGMGDTLEKWRQLERAATHFENATAAPKYEPEALYRVANIYLKLAEKEEDPKAQDALYRKAAERFSTLTTKYASTQFAKNASEPIKTLLSKGYQAKLAVSDEDVIAQWEEVVAGNKGGPDAARALVNIARLHQKPIVDEKTGNYVKPPDYEKCESACSRLLDPLAYTGEGLDKEFWSDVQTEGLYYRALCHVASLGQKPPPVPKKGEVVYLKEPSIAKALADLAKAEKQINPKQIELAKNIEMLIVESLFKSGDTSKQEEAEKRFNALVEKYPTEPRVQKVAIEIALWHHEQGNYIQAADMYQGAAERGSAVLAQDDIAKLLFMAGKLYSKAAYDSSREQKARRYGILVKPRDVIQFAGLAQSHKPFQKAVRMPKTAAPMSGLEALEKLSQQTGIPFVWQGKDGKGAITSYLKSKKLAFDDSSKPVVEVLKQILDFEQHELVLDIGLTGARPTSVPPLPDDANPDAIEAAKVIEIVRPKDWEQRYTPLTKRYGAWSKTHQGSTMMFKVVARIEKLSDTKVLLAEGLNREDVLAAEFTSVPGKNAGQDLSCAAVLAGLLESQGLTYEVVPRDLAVELYDKAKHCFNEIRKIAPKSTFGEQSLFLLAINYYQQEDYERMKIVLQEYLKVFDSSQYDHHHEACFWVGWTFENERLFRDATRYYQRAAEEQLLLRLLGTNEPMPSAGELAQQVSYDTQFGLEETVSGTMTNRRLDEAFADFIRVNSGVQVKHDISLLTTNIPIDLGTFHNRRLFDLLYGAFTNIGVTFSAENVDKAVAEKAYYRMASCYREEGMNEQALAATLCLLSRYPKTKRRRDAYKLQLQVYKALKDYRNVLGTLEALKGEMGSSEDVYKIDFEKAWIYFDLCLYADAVEHFKKAMHGAKEPLERLKIRDGYARALARAGELKDAREQYALLVKEEREPLRLFTDEMMLWYLDRAVGGKTGDRLPAAASEAVQAYEALGEDQRAEVSRELLSKVTWAYYITGLYDLMQKDPDRALAKFDAAGNSPDDSLAAEALYRAALIHRDAERYDAAKEALEYLLFTTQSAEAEVRALHTLGQVHEKLDQSDKAEARYDSLVKKFPDSAYAQEIIKARETKRKAEEEARRKAEEEAKRKAEEAKKKAQQAKPAAETAPVRDNVEAPQAKATDAKP